MQALQIKLLCSSHKRLKVMSGVWLVSTLFPNIPLAFLLLCVAPVTVIPYVCYDPTFQWSKQIPPNVCLFILLPDTRKM